MPEGSLTLILEHLQELNLLFKTIESDGGWAFVRSRLPEIYKLLNLGSYVELYQNPHSVVSLATFCRPSEEAANLINTLAGLSDSEPTELVRAATLVDGYDWLGPLALLNLTSMTTDEAYDELCGRIREITQAGDQAIIERTRAYFALMLLSFHDFLALFVHGRRISGLISKAISGDDDAFVLAVQIDRNVLSHLPYFAQRNIRAQQMSEKAFLQKLSYRLTVPPMHGRIRYGGAYLLLGLLYDMNLLGGALTDNQILDIYDKAGLNHGEQEISDVNAITKFRHRFLETHKGGVLSMQ